MQFLNAGTVDFGLSSFFRSENRFRRHELPEKSLLRAAHERSLFKLAGGEPVRELRRIAVEPSAVREFVLLDDAEELFDGRQLPCASHPAIDAQGKLPVAGHGPGSGLGPCGPQLLELM